MKKVLLVLTLVVAYGIAIANVSEKVVTVEKASLTIAADSDDFSVVVEEEKDKKKDKKTVSTETTKTKAVGEKPSTGCSDAQKKSCAASGKTCGDEKETTEKKATKSCCGSKK
jgi:hypothetical protein